MFQEMAPVSAAIKTDAETAINAVSNVETSIIFFPMVVATAVPKRKGPVNSQMAAMIRAFLAVKAPVAMIVATTLAASLKPFEKSKKRANPTMTTATQVKEVSMGNLRYAESWLCWNPRSSLLVV
jgi:hypothetical protein